MTNGEIELRGVGDPRLAVHATGSGPAWLWSIDGTRILWANPVGAKLFGAPNAAALSGRVFGPADRHRRQLAQLAGRLPMNGATRLERLRGFGAPLGSLATCACARLEFSDGVPGLLIAAAQPIGRSMPLIDRLRGLVEGEEAPIAVFARDGLFVAANDAARALLGAQNLSDSSLDQARADALQQGRVEIPLGIGHLVLQRVGVGADVGLVALLAPGATQSAAGPRHLALDEAGVPIDEPTPAPEGIETIDHVDVESEPAAEPQCLPAEQEVTDSVAPIEPVEPAIVAEPEIEQKPAPEAIETIDRPDFENEPTPEPAPEQETLPMAEPEVAEGVAPPERVEPATVAEPETEQTPEPEAIEIDCLDDQAEHAPEPTAPEPESLPVDEAEVAESVTPPELVEPAIVVEPEIEPTPAPETIEMIESLEAEPTPEPIAPEPQSTTVAEPEVAEHAAPLELVEPTIAAEPEIEPTPELETIETIETIDHLDVETESTPELITPEPESPPVAEPEVADSVASPEIIEPAIVAEVETEPTPAPVIEPVALEQPAETETPSLAEEAAMPPAIDEPPLPPRTHPLRFVWQIDAEGHFSQTSDDFARLLGWDTAGLLGQSWSEIADALEMDPEGRVAKAIATRNTWSGITLQWPVDGGEQLTIEMAGLPVRERDRQFAGYRGFGVCRDLATLTRIDAVRCHQSVMPSPLPRPLSADTCSPNSPAAETYYAVATVIEQQPSIPDVQVTTESVAPVETHPNVVPFRPASDQKSPVLTPVENSAFNELARQLSARLESETTDGTAEAETPTPTPATVVSPEWRTAPATLARGERHRDKALLDLLPVGVLIYRLDRLLYANSAFLQRIGYDSLDALDVAGGLDALVVESRGLPGSSGSEAGTPITIAAAAARLFTITWDGESALAMIFSGASAESTPVSEAAPAVAAIEPSAVGHANAEELGAILDTTTEGIVMFDAGGAINSCNRSAEALFGYDGDDLVQRNLTALFAPESQRVVLNYLESIKGTGVASLDHGREVLGQVRAGGLVPLSMTMGRTSHDGPNFFAVFRDLTYVKKTEADLMQARRVADRAAGAKADVLARISHEVRTPLNAILGFADVMIEQRFGALGNDRYIEYMKDIRASGERVFAIVNDLLDLSRIESGKLELSFTSQNLNELVEQCVAALQPQANRERIIIRTSLAHLLPPVVADARALRQITLNLIGNSIHLANAGGQVIVSTALSDFGDVVLRVRDTGHGLNENELAAAMEPFRTAAPSDQSDGAGVSLSLTKALVEANRAQFQIKSAPYGTLIEVIFSPSMAKA